MKRIVLALLVFLIASPVRAQMHKGAPTATETKAAESPAQKKAREDAYQRALKAIPEPKGKIDPWQGAR